MPDMSEFVGVHHITGHGPPIHAKKTEKRAIPKIYAAEKIIGNGSFGVVYKAVHSAVEREGEEDNDQKN